MGFEASRAASTTPPRRASGASSAAPAQTMLQKAPLRSGPRTGRWARRLQAFSSGPGDEEVGSGGGVDSCRRRCIRLRRHPSASVATAHAVSAAAAAAAHADPSVSHEGSHGGGGAAHECGTCAALAAARTRGAGGGTAFISRSVTW